MRKIIADTSSLILLYKCGAAECFMNNCCCIVHEQVIGELTEAEHEGAEFFKQSIITKTLTVKNYSGNYESGKKLHKGESGVISLYREGAGEYVLIDDGRGAAYCRDNNIPYINAILAVKVLFLSGIISGDESDRMYSWLKKNGRYSTAVIEWADAAYAELLRGFLID